jgi:DNA repair exonuclease SbcCD nuclease subunit
VLLRILLVSDLHLDAQFGWAPPNIARKRRQAIRDAFARAIQLALDERVDAICCGGDLFEHERVSPDTGQFLRQQLERAQPISVFIAPGNHDWFGPASLYATTAWTPNVHVFGDAALSPVALAEGLTLWGAAHCAPAGTRNFLEGFRVDRSGTHVALFHGSELGAAACADAASQPHAPFRRDEIPQAGLRFAMLGHYHAPVDHPHFCYPGNPEPLNFGECGQRGAVLVDIGDDGQVSTSRRPLAISSVHDLAVDVSGCTTKHSVRELVEAALEGLTGYARVTVSGELGVDVDLVARDLDDIKGGLETPALVRFADMGVAYDFERIAREPTVRGQFVTDVQASDLSAQEKRRVLITGLRALDGRQDLEVF